MKGPVNQYLVLNLILNCILNPRINVYKRMYGYNQLLILDNVSRQTALPLPAERVGLAVAKHHWCLNEAQSTAV